MEDYIKSISEIIRNHIYANSKCHIKLKDCSDQTFSSNYSSNLINMKIRYVKAAGCNMTYVFSSNTN